jgi:hypothetical protein
MYYYASSLSFSRLLIAATFHWLSSAFIVTLRFSGRYYFMKIRHVFILSIAFEPPHYRHSRAAARCRITVASFISLIEYFTIRFSSAAAAEFSLR